MDWLGQSFFDAWNTAHTMASRSPGLDAEQTLLSRAWPDNVRELRSAIKRACLLMETQRIEVSLLRDEGEPDDILAAPESGAVGASMPTLEDFLRLQEREFIRQALQRHDIRIGVTADALGISRKGLRERMKRLATG